MQKKPSCEDCLIGQTKMNQNRRLVKFPSLYVGVLAFYQSALGTDKCHVGDSMGIKIALVVASVHMDSGI